MVEYSGDGSFYRLISNIYGINKENNFLYVVRKYQEYNNEIEIDNIFSQLHFNFMHSGYYVYNTGLHASRTSYGDYLGSKAFNGPIGILEFSATRIQPQRTDTRGYGSSVRRVAKSNFY